MFENLSAKLSQITRKLINQHRLNENDINDFLRQIRMALLEADVNFKVVKSLIESIKTDTINPEFSKSLNPGNLLVESLKQHLTKILPNENSEIPVFGIIEISISPCSGLISFPPGKIGSSTPERFTISK